MSWKPIVNVWRCTKYNFCVRTFSLLNRMSFYAVAIGRTPGIFMTWPDCEAQVKGFSGARYKKFNTVVEAQKFITVNGNKTKDGAPKKSSNLYNPHSNQINQLRRTYSGDKNEDSVSSKRVKIKPRTNQVNKELDKHDMEDLEEDDINDVLNKQMDAIEKGIKGVKKNVDRIIKENSVPTLKGKKAILLESPIPTKRRRTPNFEFETDDDGYVQVYTDGACSSNGQRGARAGLGVYWADDHPLNTSEPVSGRATNNCGEIQAATRAINLALQNGVTHLAINTDSQFLINSVTKWMPGWKRKGWKLKSGEPVKNEIDFKELDSVKDKLNVKWNYVVAHNGVYGNEMADRLAKDGAALYSK